MSNNQKLSLRVGGVYLNGFGEQVEIVSEDTSPETEYPFFSSQNLWYTRDGRFCAVAGIESNYHLVFELIEQSQTLTQADLQRLSELVRGEIEFEHQWLTNTKVLVNRYWPEAIAGTDEGKNSFEMLNHYKNEQKTSRKRIKALSETQKRLKATLRKIV